MEVKDDSLSVNKDIGEEIEEKWNNEKQEEERTRTRRVLRGAGTSKRVVQSLVPATILPIYNFSRQFREFSREISFCAPRPRFPTRPKFHACFYFPHASE